MAFKTLEKEKEQTMTKTSAQDQEKSGANIRYFELNAPGGFVIYAEGVEIGESIFDFSTVFISNPTLSIDGVVISSKARFFSRFEYLYVNIIENTNEFRYIKKKNERRRIKMSNPINDPKYLIIKNFYSIMSFNSRENWKWCLITISEDIGERELINRMKTLGERLFGKRNGSLRFFWVKETDTKYEGAFF